MTNMEYAHIKGLINQYVTKEKISDLCSAVFWAISWIVAAVVLYRFRTNVWHWVSGVLNILLYICPVASFIYAWNSIHTSDKLEEKSKKLKQLAGDKKITAEEVMIELKMGIPN